MLEGFLWFVSSTATTLNQNRSNALLKLGFYAIIFLTQKRNRKINGRSFYTLSIQSEMVNLTQGVDFNSHYITIKKASSLCGISISTIERRTKEGSFPPKIKTDPAKKGGSVRFLVLQIEEWLNGKRSNWNLLGGAE